jgi:membrane protein required for colicin V production
LSLLLGLWRGVVGEIIALVAWVLAFLARGGFDGSDSLLALRDRRSGSASRPGRLGLVFVVVLMLMALVAPGRPRHAQGAWG